MTKRVLIVFHSVCGNTFLLARLYQKAYAAHGIHTELRRVPDAHLTEFAHMFPAGRETLAQIEQVPVMESGSEALGYDALLLGSPTYFGNVSGPVKLFMDSFCALFSQSPFSGVHFACFATASASTGGGSLCLQAMNTFAMHMGMQVLPVPATLPGGPQPAYGLLHIAGEDSAIRPGPQMQSCVDALAQQHAQWI